MKRFILLLLFLCSGLSASELSKYYPIIETEAFSFQYNPKTGNPLYVMYILSLEDLNGDDIRQGMYFRVFKLIPYPQGPCENTDLGHLCPAADRMKMMRLTFIYPNQCPMYKAFNRGDWKTLETALRKRVRLTKERLLIITGPIGGNKLPTHFFKIIKSLTNGELTAYLFPHRDISTGDISQFVTDIETVEKAAGVYFPNLR